MKLSVYSASIALPAWLLIGGVYEYYIFLGTQSYPHLCSKFHAGSVGSCSFIASLGMFSEMGGVIWFLLPKLRLRSVFRHSSLSCSLNVFAPI